MVPIFVLVVAANDDEVVARLAPEAVESEVVLGC